MSFVFDRQVENDRPNTQSDEMFRTGERIKTFRYFSARGGVYSLFKSHYL